MPRTSLWRRYYTTRNYIFLMRRTFDRPDLARREVVRALGRCATSISGGPAYAVHFTRHQLRGVRDGLAERMGATIAPSGTA
jgi:hypothetical protein